MSYETLEPKHEGPVTRLTLNRQAIAMEDRNQVLCSTSPDLIEGVTAFLQKRPPVYKYS